MRCTSDMFGKSSIFASITSATANTDPNAPQNTQDLLAEPDVAPMLQTIHSETEQLVSGNYAKIDALLASTASLSERNQKAQAIMLELEGVRIAHVATIKANAAQKIMRKLVESGYISPEFAQNLQFSTKRIRVNEAVILPKITPDLYASSPTSKPTALRV